MLTLGTGVGGGVVIDGRLLRDAAELGHVVIDYDGIPCQGTCTGRGHLEGYASGTAATRRAREAFGPEADSRQLVTLARDGNEAAREIVADIGGRLGAAIGSFVNVFGPDLVVLGGGFAAATDLLLGPAQQTMLREALPPWRDRVRIVRAELGSTAGVIGAGLVAVDALA
jgi:glucokinase